MIELVYDRAGNEICGESFMAGTICSDTPGHGGGHSCLCQTCGGDWMNETCTCGRRCLECGTRYDDKEPTGYCPDCRCGQSNEQCMLHWQHVDSNTPCQHRAPPKVTDEEVAEVFGVPLEVVSRGNPRADS